MEIGADPLDPLGVLASKLCKHRGECKKRRCEDDRDNARHVDLERNVGGSTTVLASADHALCVLNRNSALSLLEVDNHNRDDKHQAEDREDSTPLTTLADGQELRGHARGNRGEDQERHTVTDAALGDQFTQPHDDAGTGGHHDHHEEESPHGV